MQQDNRVVALLEELLIWTRFSALDSLRTVLRDALAEPTHLRAYELTDGKHTQAQVGIASSLTQQAVSTLWQKWKALGIIVERNGRLVRLVNPHELGIEWPRNAKDTPRRRSTREPIISSTELDDERT